MEQSRGHEHGDYSNNGCCTPTEELVSLRVEASVGVRVSYPENWPQYPGVDGEGTSSRAWWARRHVLLLSALLGCTLSSVDFVPYPPSDSYELVAAHADLCGCVVSDIARYLRPVPS